MRLPELPWHERFRLVDFSWLKGGFSNTSFRVGEDDMQTVQGGNIREQWLTPSDLTGVSSLQPCLHRGPQAIHIAPGKLPPPSRTV